MRQHAASRTPFVFFALLLIFAAVLVLLFWISLDLRGSGHLTEWFKVFVDLNMEANLPTWFTSSLWLMAAYFSWRAGLSSKGPGKIGGQAFYWFVLAGGCVLLSLDESAGLHEGIGGLLNERSGRPGGSLPVYSWVWPGLAVVCVSLVVFIRFLARLPRQTAIGLIGAGGVFLLGAIGMETMGSLIESETLSDWPRGFSWNRAIAAEEFLEMVGVILYVMVVQRHLTLAPARATEGLPASHGVEARAAAE